MVSFENLPRPSWSQICTEALANIAKICPGQHKLNGEDVRLADGFGTGK